MATKSKASRGRKTNTNRGYWYRTGRGWFASVGGKHFPLFDQQGCKLLDRNLDKSLAGKQTLAAALTAFHAQQSAIAAADPDAEEIQIKALAKLYLDYSRKNDRPTTWQMRERYLFDLCSGFPAEFINAEEPPPASARLHKGYGALEAAKFSTIDLDQFLAAHPNWAKAGGVRAAVQAIRRMFVYGVKGKKLTVNPIRGCKVAKPNKRKTYFTPEQEAALLLVASHPDENGGRALTPLGLALKVCIRLGLRPKEFWQMTAKHVVETPKGMNLKYEATEIKTDEDRIIYVPNNGDIADIIRQRIALYPTGRLFRNSDGQPWNSGALKNAFPKVADRVRKTKGQDFFDKDTCFYTCRHTFAKRTLNGYWTGKPCNIEQLAKLMGNTPEICREHYADWCDMYTDPLWAAIG